MPPITAGALRIRAGETLILQYQGNVGALAIVARIRVLNDLGLTQDYDIALAGLSLFAYQAASVVVTDTGWIVGMWMTPTGGQQSRGAGFATLYIGAAGGGTAAQIRSIVASGWIGGVGPLLGFIENKNSLPWPVADASMTFRQNNAAGGAIKVDIVPGDAYSGFSIVNARIVMSGTNGLNVITYDNVTSLDIMGVNGVLATGAAQNLSLPSPGQAANASGNVNTMVPGSSVIAGNESFSIEQTLAGLQNDTMQLSLNVVFYGALPIIVKTRSTNPSDVSITVGSSVMTIKG